MRIRILIVKMFVTVSFR